MGVIIKCSAEYVFCSHLPHKYSQRMISKIESRDWICILVQIVGVELIVLKADALRQTEFQHYYTKENIQQNKIKNIYIFSLVVLNVL